MLNRNIFFIILWVLSIGGCAQHHYNVGNRKRSFGENAGINALSCGCYSLHIAAQFGHANCIDALIDRGANVNKREEYLDNETPLHTAAKYGHANCIHALVDRGADVNVGNGKRTALHVAAEYGRTNCIHALADRGANVNQTGGNVAFALDQRDWAPLHVATRFGRTSCIHALVDRGADVNDRSIFGSALHIAAEYGRANCIYALRDRGASISIMTNWKETALHVAAKYGHVDCIRALPTLAYRTIPGRKDEADLKRWLDVDAQDQIIKRTPLHLAAERGHADCIRALVDKEACLDLRDRNNETPLDLATKYGHTACIRELKNRAAQLLPPPPPYQPVSPALPISGVRSSTGANIYNVHYPSTSTNMGNVVTTCLNQVAPFCLLLPITNPMDNQQDHRFVQFSPKVTTTGQSSSNEGDPIIKQVKVEPNALQNPGNN